MWLNKTVVELTRSRVHGFPSDGLLLRVKTKGIAHAMRVKKGGGVAKIRPEGVMRLSLICPHTRNVHEIIDDMRECCYFLLARIISMHENVVLFMLS